MLGSGFTKTALGYINDGSKVHAHVNGLFYASYITDVDETGSVGRSLCKSSLGGVIATLKKLSSDEDIEIKLKDVDKDNEDAEVSKKLSCACVCALSSLCVFDMGIFVYDF